MAALAAAEKEEEEDAPVFEEDEEEEDAPVFGEDEISSHISSDSGSDADAYDAIRDGKRPRLA